MVMTFKEFLSYNSNCVHITKCLFHSFHAQWTTQKIFNLDHKDKLLGCTGKWVLLDENGSAA